MINIFGKLYTLLRRPQPQNEPQEDTSQPEAPGDTESDETSPPQQNEGQTTPGTQEVESEGTTDDTCPPNQNERQVTLGTQEEEPDNSNCGVEDVYVETESGITEPAGNLSGTNVDLICVETVQSKEVGESSNEKQVTGNETMDMAAMAKLVAEMQEESKKKDENLVSNPGANLENAEKLEENHDLEGETKRSLAPEAKDLGHDIDEVKENNEVKAKDEEKSKKNDKGEIKEKKGKKEKKACYYFKKGLQCYKGRKCAYSHDRDWETPQENTQKAKVYLREEDFSSYKDFIAAMTTNGNNINPKDLLYKLGYEKLDMDTMGSVLIGQYKLASSRQRWQWVSQARYYAELFFPYSWIDDNLPSRDGRKLAKKDKPSNKQRKSKYNANEQFDGSRTMCQDVRLLENPNLPVISTNFGKKDTKPQEENVDEFVTEYTTGIINEAVRIASEAGNDTDKAIRGAMREAIDEGLSESMIMEVINDVTKGGGSTAIVGTPGRRGKVNKPDIKRTPRKRPDELAVGFNYLADELVKHSPKTVDGGIICMDTLPPSKERQEQLAFGFNFHADKLVKESPVSEKGDVLIPGVVLTPGRKARDQLAMGFNYHSDMVAKESPKSANLEKRPVSKETKKNLSKRLYDPETFVDENVHLVDPTGDAGHKIKNTQEDKLAIGFSKNADLIAHADEMVMKVLGEKDMNMVKEHSSNIQAEFDEERHNDETVDSFVVIPSRLPAGSVW